MSPAKYKRLCCIIFKSFPDDRDIFEEVGGFIILHTVFCLLKGRQRSNSLIERAHLMCARLLRCEF